jgi:hypothetical protein
MMSNPFIILYVGASPMLALLRLSYAPTPLALGQAKPDPRLYPYTLISL